MGEWCAQKNTWVRQWPALFEITALAKLIITFIPKLQVKQWVRKSSGEWQHNICSWLTKEDIDNEMQDAMIAADNVWCVQYIQTRLSSNMLSFLQLPIPNILSKLLYTLPVCDGCTLWYIPLCNMKILATHPEWTQTMTIQLIKRGFALHQTDEWLAGVLSLVPTPVEVGMEFGSLFDAKLWNMRRSFIQSGQCSIQTIEWNYLASMPLSEFCLVPDLVYKSWRLELCIMFCLDTYNWSVTNYLWHSDFETDLKTELDRRIEMSIDSYCDSLDIGEEEFNCRYQWDNQKSCKFSFPNYNVELLNSALQFVAEQQMIAGSLRDVINTWITNLFEKTEMAALAIVFERACLMGHYYIVHAIWQYMSPSDRQRMNLETKLAQCRVCDNIQMFEFAWSKIGPTICNNPLQWIRTAYNNNNWMLWKFLYEKHVLLKDHLFDNGIVIDYRGKAENLAQSLGQMSVCLLATVWDVEGMQSTQNVDGICYAACTTNNTAVLQFLNEHHANISQRLESDMWMMCQLGLTNLMLRIKDTSWIGTNFCYKVVTSKARELLWCIAPLTNFTRFLQKTDPSFESCIFLLEKQAFSTQFCIDTLKQSKMPDIALIKAIHAHTYCDADDF